MFVLVLLIESDVEFGPPPLPPPCFFGERVGVGLVGRLGVLACETWCWLVLVVPLWYDTRVYGTLPMVPILLYLYCCTGTYAGTYAGTFTGTYTGIPGTYIPVPRRVSVPLPMPIPVPEVPCCAIPGRYRHRYLCLWYCLWTDYLSCLMVPILLYWYLYRYLYRYLCNGIYIVVPVPIPVPIPVSVPVPIPVPVYRYLYDTGIYTGTYTGTYTVTCTIGAPCVAIVTIGTLGTYLPVVLMTTTAFV